jgi:ABC-type branched-subunit amino acid transport system substrate-binding protein
MRRQTLRPALGFRLLLVAAAVALGLVAAGVAQGKPQASSGAAKCPFPNNTIRMFTVQDLSAVIGQEIGPAGARALRVWTDDVNKRGGILGCKFVYDIKDDAFEIPTCLRLYRDALASRKYDFFMGPTNSGCMAALPDLTNAAGKALFSGIAADHQPFFEKFTPLTVHGSVSTFLEGRASAVFAKKMGWKNFALMVPNYAYGQDVGKGFKEYIKQIVPASKIVNEQFPEFNEDNFTPFINAMVAKKPDMVLTAFFGPFIVPFWKQWKAGGHDDIPAITGLAVLATFQVAKTASDIPKNAYGFTRADWQLLQRNPVGKQLHQLYQSRWGKQHPVTSEFAYQVFSSLQYAKGLIEKSRSLDPKAWKETVERGDFSFQGPYNSGPTYVNPINHMADNCAAVGKVVWNPKIPYKASYDAKTFVVSCMRDVLGAAEARKLTKNPDVSDAAVKRYYGLVSKLK